MPKLSPDTEAELLSVSQSPATLQPIPKTSQPDPALVQPTEIQLERSAETTIHGAIAFKFFGPHERIVEALAAIKRIQPPTVACCLFVDDEKPNVAGIALFGERAGIDEIMAKLEPAIQQDNMLPGAEKLILSKLDDTTDTTPKPKVQLVTGSWYDPAGQVLWY
jgi:hypothetical protein